MKSLSDQLRSAIERCGLTRYRIAQETGIPESSLTRFMQGTAGLSLDSIDRVSELLRLRLEMDGPRKAVLDLPRRGR